MTEKEALYELIRSLPEKVFGTELYCEAYDMAIKALEKQDKYRWHDLRDENETERFPEIVAWGQRTNTSEAVEVTDGYKIYDTAMVVEWHTEGDRDKVYDRFWYFGEGGKWEEMGNIRAWRYIKPFCEEEEQ